MQNHRKSMLLAFRMPLGGLLWVVFGRLVGVWGLCGRSRGRPAALLTDFGMLPRPRRDFKSPKAQGTACKGVL
eukprot:347577-Pyramimonas_sp.AAC.1